MRAVHRAIIAGTAHVIADPLWTAHTHWTRLRGLIGTTVLPQGKGLWIRPCRQVHMFWMRYPIDVVFLDAAHTVVAVVTHLQPWRVSPKVSTAESVIELPAGTVERLPLHSGTAIDIVPA